jgi:hypothetical protein
MARIPVATGNNPNFPLSPIIDTQGKVNGVIIQNVSTVDCFVSDDPNTLQQTVFGANPLVGIHFPPDTAGITPFMLVIPYFRGKLYARAQNPGSVLEVVRYEICPPASVNPDLSQSPA